MEGFVDFASKSIAFIALVVGAAWGAVKYWRRDEHFPRVVFEVTGRFVGEQGGKVLVEVVAMLENKGVVPVRIRDLGFKVRGIMADEPLADGGEAIRGQTEIPHLLGEGTFVPAHWEHTFIYPDVKTEYNYIMTLDPEVSFVRIESSFSYERDDSSHHAAKLLKVSFD